MVGRCGSIFGVPESLFSSLSCNQIDGVYVFAVIMTVITMGVLLYVGFKKPKNKTPKQKEIKK